MYRLNQGFSLLEILITLLILSGSIVIMFSGFDKAAELDMFASFESESAFLAEREIELLKTELLHGRIKPRTGSLGSRFRLKPGWKMTSVMTAADSEEAVRLICSINKGDRLFQLESFVFVPSIGVTGVKND
ncbi:MAG: prepilin-type N-terminal cleavage/methylation domain-containing protein [Candidatus Riflebacteria bacterium]|nr:prepilin-type N-terminal cleavage/methylation domain-containing protein [Candidatus Riflebacteria bacterium]